MAENLQAKQTGSTPVAAHPDVASAATMSPVAGNPNRVRMRAWRPATSDPDPVSAPFPTPRNPKPKCQRAGGHRYNFNLRRRGGLRLGHNDLAWRRTRRWGRLHDGHGSCRAFHNTAREQRQAGGNQKVFDQN